MHDAGVRTRDLGFRIHNTGFGMQDSGLRIHQDSGPGIQSGVHRGI